jgi:hypothetical protein
MDRRRSSISVFLLLILTGAIYIRPAVFFGDQMLAGSDYFQLHIRHIAFARDALFGPRHFLPAWYPRELFGAPFSSNIQSFPWIPTRLVLFAFDPAVAFAAGVAIAALLAALFTYLYCKRVGLSEVGSVTAGWTFACAGFFASRVFAGHLPLLEAYPALPLLLWLGERALATDRIKTHARDLVTLAAATGCVALAGHPQIPTYSIAAAMLYVVFRGRGWIRWRTVGAMALGIGLTMAAWWPMLLLVRRSTRVLPLAPASNDLALPYGRLLALIVPGVDGWPDSLSAGNRNPFHGYPHDGYFWDTASYFGLLPVFAIVLLFGWSLFKRRSPNWPWLLLVALGTGALFFALPLADPLRQLFPGTFLRSPARLLYLTTFSAAALLGFGIDAFLESGFLRSRVRQSLVAIVLAAHFFDLGGFARQFVQPEPRSDIQADQFAPILAREIQDGQRIASYDTLYRNDYDDAGIFDSIMLANPYRAFLRFGALPPNLNEQLLDASSFTASALQASGVKIVITPNLRDDLELLSESDEAYLYRVPNPVPRAWSQAATQKVAYFRPSSDEIHLEVVANDKGVVHVMESNDPGWSATVDGTPAPIELANGFAMAVPVSPGKHVVDLRYRTPGRRVGWALSLLSALLLAGLVSTTRASRRPVT